MQFGTLLAAIRCPRPYGSRQYHRRETFQKNLASVHKKSVSEAATATDVFSRSYCCSLESVLQRYGASGLTGLDNTRTQGWTARKLGKRRLSCAGFRVRHAAVFQWIALRAAITRLVCRLSCGCGGRAGAFELIGPCALIWCLAFLRCDLYGDCAKRATVFDLIGLCAFSLFVALPLALWLRCVMTEIE